MADDTDQVIDDLLSALAYPGEINAGFAASITSQLLDIRTSVRPSRAPLSAVRRRRVSVHRDARRRPAVSRERASARSAAREGDIAQVFVELADSLRGDRDALDTMDVLVRAVVRLTSAVDAGIVLANTDRQLRIIASTHERAADVEETQLGAGEGPCLDSFATASPIDVPDLQNAHDLWPRFVPHAIELGFRGVHATPLTVDGRAVGALNLFFDAVDAFSERDAVLVDAMARIATVGLMQRRRVEQQSDLADQLRRTLETRSRIETAKDVLARRRGIESEDAFDLIRRRARARGVPIRAAAERFVAERGAA